MTQRSPASRVEVWIGAGLILGLFAACTTTAVVYYSRPPALPQAPGDAQAGDAGAPPVGERRGVVLAESAGGNPRFVRPFLEAGEEQRRSELAAVGLRNPVTGSYSIAGIAPEATLTFAGGEWASTMAEEAVVADANARLDEAFRRLRSGTYDGTMRTFDAGPLGGQVRCTTLQGADRTYVACGWVDRWTTGSVVDARRGRTEAAGAELLALMRTDLEVVKP
jgi:hypothetical protein